ncbi:Amino acid transporter [Trypanosoma melophagium]|uniref:Amino acid transporter n=1 Tax=Trypanosoma melophagium TaxID=715481 RepID=UPI00351AA5B0|nr:Amino acid transporter [Trypanosoma melophagium]
MDSEEGGSPTHKSTQVPMSEVTTLLTFSPVESSRDSTRYLPQRAGSMSLSHIFPPRLERRFFYCSNGGMVASAFNLTSATLGAGTLAVPNAVYHSGILLSSIALLVCVISTLYSVYLLAFVIEVTGNSTYEEMARYCFGRALRELLLL